MRRSTIQLLFSLMSLPQACIHFNYCSDYTTSCTDCVSGSSYCRPEGEDGDVCDLQGLRCQGDMIDFFETPSEAECLRQCKRHDSCLWSTFNRETGLCVMTEECPGTEICEGCFITKSSCSASIR